MTSVPASPFWRTSGFWAGLFLAVMLYAVVRETFGKDEAARRRILRRVLIAVGVLWLGLHAWAAWELVAGLRGLSILGPRLTLKDQAVVVYDALFISAASWTLAGATLAAVVIFSQPPRRGGRFPWLSLGTATALTLGAFFVPQDGTRDPRFPPVMGETQPGPTWIDRAFLLAGLTTVMAILVIIASGISRLFGKGPTQEVRKEELRRDLVLWGALLFVGAVLLLERRAMESVNHAAILGPLSPGWRAHAGEFLLGSRQLLFAALLGLVALCFGILHLKRRGAQDVEA